MVKYLNGNLLESDCNIICHCTNCNRGFGSGIAAQIRKKFPRAYICFCNRHDCGEAKLGKIDMIKCHPFVYVCNMYAQFHYYPRNIRHFDYDAFRTCLKELKLYLTNLGMMDYKIGFPDHIGCGLAGGDWETTKQIIEEEFSSHVWNVKIIKLEN